jgi:hypothetical protein
VVDDGIDGIFDEEVLVMVLILQNQSFREDLAIMMAMVVSLQLGTSFWS